MSDKARECWVRFNPSGSADAIVGDMTGIEWVHMREIAPMDKETEADLDLISALLVEPDADTTADEWAAWGRIRAKLGGGNG